MGIWKLNDHNQHRLGRIPDAMLKNFERKLTDPLFDGIFPVKIFIIFLVEKKIKQNLQETFGSNFRNPWDKLRKEKSKKDFLQYKIV